MNLRSNCLYIYADGASSPKPRKGGIGITYVFLDKNEEEQHISLEEFGYASATNNQMELKAVIKGLQESQNQTIEIDYNFIEIRTDSMYVVENSRRAINSWSKNKWFNYDGKPVENAFLWKELVKAMKEVRCRVEFKWVKGHAKDEYNKMVDKLAKKSAQAYLNPPLTQIKSRRKKSKNTTKVGCVKMEGQEISIRVINEEYLRVQKLSKYRYEVISVSSPFYEKIDIIYSEHHHLKAGHNYIVIVNTDNKNPRILEVIKEIDSKTFQVL